MSKIKSPATSFGGKIKPPASSSVEIENFPYPVFCLKHLQKGRGLDYCDTDEKAAFADRLHLLSQSTWQELQQTHRHGMGFEKIARGALPALPNFITEDVSHLLAFRFSGKKPMLGHRNRFVFHIIFIDRDFSLYDHG